MIHFRKRLVAAGLSCQHIENLLLDNVRLHAHQGPALQIENTQGTYRNLSLDGSETANLQGLRMVS